MIISTIPKYKLKLTKKILKNIFKIIIMFQHKLAKMRFKMSLLIKVKNVIN